MSLGGFGTVFKVKHRLDDKIFAVKRVQFKDFNEEDKQKVLKEAKMLSKLDSNFVVKFYYSWIESNYLYIQMEYCSQNLKQIIDEKAIVFERQPEDPMNIFEYFICCEIFKEVLECVQYIHESNPPVIHRDLNPRDILITINNNNNRFIKLGDFGLATDHDMPSMSHTGNVGRPGYMAPEIHFISNYTTKVDIYSLALIAHHLFDLFKIEHQMEKYNITMLSTNIKKLYEIIEQMLEPIPGKRPTSAQILQCFNQWYIDKSLITGDNTYNDILQNIISGKTNTTPANTSTDWVDDFYSRMRCERTRLGTYHVPGHDWPNANVTPGDLASAGFFYTLTDDMVECAFCGLGINEWVPGDRPLDQHRIHSPLCPFITGNDMSNLPISNDHDGFIIPHPSLTPDIPDDINSNFGFNSARVNIPGLGVAVNQHIPGSGTSGKRHVPGAGQLDYTDIDVRMKSYVCNGWDLSIPVPIDRLSAAGFYYLGRSDWVKCFCCGGKARDWSPGDNPWVEHEKMYPDCHEDKKQTILKEVKCLAKLDSEYVVKYYHSWLESNHLFIQMEFCSQSLKSVLKDKPNVFGRQPNEAMNILCEIFKELLECVEYLHESNPPLIHRDLKPDNILIKHNVRNNRFVKLCDFGLATDHMISSMSLTAGVGTSQYMAIETYQRRYTTKSDIYSLGSY
ncbi:unnamed protein product [Medioppia subpectinata]|uniref:non-specific serine/threonine protein kinase n=1 Tax=Medioppia subpectinata TaxID=1979941 RepID=A0A7R9PTL6_9ACAR|nr:unnamed protein product [Medioppia subpectinata]CAG2100266.1 unnamed protein product [Medioppia subpectinata]